MNDIYWETAQQIALPPPFVEDDRLENIDSAQFNPFFEPVERVVNVDRRGHTGGDEFPLP